MNYGIKAYKSVGIKDDLAVADPYRVIQLLMQGALENMAKAKGAIERKDYTIKAQTLGKAVAIIGALRNCLDMNVAGDISGNLADLYQFMIDHLSIASREQNIEKIDDVIDLMLTIKSAWDQIPPEAREEAYNIKNDFKSAIGA